MLIQIAIVIAIMALILACYAIFAFKKIQQLQSQFAEDIEAIKVSLKNHAKTAQEAKAHSEQITLVQSRLKELTKQLENKDSSLIATQHSQLVPTMLEKVGVVSPNTEVQPSIEENIPVLSTHNSNMAALESSEHPVALAEIKYNNQSVALRNAVNDILSKQDRMTNKTVLEHLAKYIEADSVKLKTSVYYLDGTPSDGLAELVIIDLDNNYYVVPHSNSLANPYLSGWFSTEQGSQVAIKQWPEIVYHQETAKIECVNKGVLTV